MKHLKLYESNKKYKKYLIVKRRGDEEIIKFYILEVIRQLLDCQPYVRQIKYWYDGILGHDGDPFYLNLDDIECDVIYETDELKDSLDMLPILATTDKYNI